VKTKRLAAKRVALVEGLRHDGRVGEEKGKGGREIQRAAQKAAGTNTTLCPAVRVVTG
jgi:hypothetical protein